MNKQQLNNAEKSVRGTDQRENAIEWYTGNAHLTVSLSQRRFINSMKETAKKYPGEVQIIKENADGTVLLHVPLSYLKLRRPREMPPELVEAARNRMNDMIARGKINPGKKGNDK